MCNSIEWGRCEICGKETQLERTYFYYPIHKNIFDVQMNTWWCGWITIKTFVASDICTDSIDYAKACAQELLDKLREELL